MPVAFTLSKICCNQCGYLWIPRQPELPKRCPRCHSRRLHKSGPYGLAQFKEEHVSTTYD